MNELEKALQRLPKIDPEEGFLKLSKERLMHQIKLQSEEGYLGKWLKKWGTIDPSQTFITEARSRLMYRIQQFPSPAKSSVHRLAYALSLLKKTVASSLVMVIAVTATLFYVEGNTVVEASDDSYLEVLSGTASVKHADMLAWETVSNQIELQAGDLIRLKEDAQAIIHFFDDSQIRLNQNTTLLISQLVVSPAYAGQGIIEVNLNEGEAWVQTLNVEDGYAHFSLATPEALVKSLHGSFNVKKEGSSTEVALFDGKADLFQLDPVTQRTLKKSRLMASQKVVIEANADLLIADLEDEDRQRAWVERNLERNRAHLADLRAKDIGKLTLMAGSLPGDTLYFIKKAKEDLKLVWSDDTDMSLKIEIANKRLNEAIVLLESGEVESGKQALATYEALAKEIAQVNKKQDDSGKKLAHQLIVPHQKFLTAQPTTNATVIVKDSLHKTAEMLAENPVELVAVKLRNSVDKLEDTKALVESGDLEAAKEKLADYVADENILIALESLGHSEEQKKVIEEVLALKEEKQVILASVSKEIGTSEAADSDLVALAQTAASSATTDLQQTLVAVLPLFPELVESSNTIAQAPGTSPAIVAALSPETLRALSIVEKINIYNTWQGQKNQIDRLLVAEIKDPAKIDYLTTIRNQLDGRAQDYLSTIILGLRNQLAAPAPVIITTTPESEVITADPTEPTQTGETGTTSDSTQTDETGTVTTDPTRSTTDPIPQ